MVHSNPWKRLANICCAHVLVRSIPESLCACESPCSYTRVRFEAHVQTSAVPSVPFGEQPPKPCACESPCSYAHENHLFRLLACMHAHEPAYKCTCTHACATFSQRHTHTPCGSFCKMNEATTQTHTNTHAASFSRWHGSQALASARVQSRILAPCHPRKHT